MLKSGKKEWVNDRQPYSDEGFEEQLTRRIQAIQLDAFKAGMREAAILCEKQRITGHGKNGLHNLGVGRCQSAILTAAENKTTIP